MRYSASVVNFYPKISYYVRLLVTSIIGLGFFGAVTYELSRLAFERADDRVVIGCVALFFAFLALSCAGALFFTTRGLIKRRPSLEATETTLVVTDILGRRHVRAWADLIEIKELYERIGRASWYSLVFVGRDRRVHPDLGIPEGRLNTSFEVVVDVLMNHTGARSVAKVQREFKRVPWYKPTL